MWIILFFIKQQFHGKVVPGYFRSVADLIEQFQLCIKSLLLLDCLSTFHHSNFHHSKSTLSLPFSIHSSNSCKSSLLAFSKIHKFDKFETGLNHQWHCND